MSDDRPTREQQTEREFTQFARDMAKLVGKFVLDLARLTGRGLWLAYRAIGRRRAQEVRSGEAAARRGNSTLEAVQERVRGALQREEAPADTAGEITTQTDTDESAPSIIDPDVVEDAEAAALLEDLLQETAAKQTTDAASAMETESQSRDDTTSDSTADHVDTAPPPPTADAVEDQLKARQARLVEEGGPAPDPEAEHNAAIQAQIEADKARIRAEREQRTQAFQQAEAERRAREQARKDALRPSRLVDTEPPDAAAAADDGATAQQFSNNED
jgi:hypothetical protein